MSVSHPEPHLVMIGGVGCDESLWDDQVAALSDTVHCRPLVATGNSIEDMASNVLSCVTGSFSLVGHSMGGYVSLAIQRMAPERVERLAIIGSGASVEQPDQRKARMELLDLVCNKGFDALVGKLAPAMVGPDTRCNAPMMDRLVAMLRRTGGERFIREQTAVMNRPDPRAALAHIDVPFLAIAGKDDRIVPPDHGAETAALINGGQFRLLERCGHIAPVELADAVSALLRAWVCDEILPATHCVPVHD